MRRLLLWMASNRWLRDRVPRLWFARRAVRRFMPGEDAAAALSAGAAFEREGIATLYTELGENLANIAEADRVADGYVALLERIRAAGLNGEVSVKLTQLGLDLDPERTLEHAQRLATRAAETGASTLWIDMEGSAYTDATLGLYSKVRSKHHETGVCLQAYLHRTAADLGGLMAEGAAIRLVKGAYAEAPDKAFQSRRDVDANYLALSALMLAEVRRGRLRMVLGTHDVVLVRRIADLGAAVGVGRGDIEVDMLYGIRTGELESLASEGHPCRVLIAYGSAWYPWYVRRLAERPANVWFVARQMLP
jgi:proline dehydrogenase